MMSDTELFLVGTSVVRVSGVYLGALAKRECAARIELTFLVNDAVQARFAVSGCLIKTIPMPLLYTVVGEHDSLRRHPRCRVLLKQGVSYHQPNDNEQTKTP
jgi:hypothetical protein